MDGTRSRRRQRLAERVGSTAKCSRLSAAEELERQIAAGEYVDSEIEDDVLVAAALGAIESCEPTLAPSAVEWILARAAEAYLESCGEINRDMRRHPGDDPEAVRSREAIKSRTTGKEPFRAAHQVVTQPVLRHAPPSQAGRGAVSCRARTRKASAAT